ncbi:hypothetical protein SKAU_G00156940 [Synaphobranchus kaupii]|uniref:SGNH hydrolase-type esterase domain-containing protein n=1 Tax=Synaphobranchus kaupii TaxID=118154 RepID=A0A9Q1FI42_SYNKA|nr:hypothetical protein SKAU_G00156940 [Synaphobranchus kaupii]
MTPLTSPSGCDGCFCLSEKVAVLEQRIHNLYKIQEADKLLYTIVFGGPAQGSVSSAEERAGTASSLADAASPSAAASTPPTTAAAPAAVPAAAATSVPADPWLLLGAKPKSLFSCSTLLFPEHWEVVGDRRKRGRLSLPSSRAPATQEIQLENCYDILGEDFPSLAAGQQSLPSLPPPSSISIPKCLCWSGGPGGGAGCPAITSCCPATEVTAPGFIPSPPYRASYRSGNLRSCCPLPPSPSAGATVQDIAEKIPGILNSYPEVDRVLLHVGVNDIRKQQSELLYRDFTHLLNIVKQSHSNVYVSEPTPTHRRGMGSFTWLLSLNTWLSSACDTNGVHFVENFNLFWKHDHLFGAVRQPGIQPPSSLCFHTHLPPIKSSRSVQC